jgi:uncharacterized RmlC-like cupin family protein
VHAPAQNAGRRHRAAHLHEAHETPILVLGGRARMRYGEGLSQELEVATGDFLYIPAGMPHQRFNAGDEPCRAVIARTDPNSAPAPDEDQLHQTGFL